MKKTQTNLLLAALLATLAPTSVYAVNTCATIFADQGLSDAILAKVEAPQTPLHANAVAASYKPASLPEIVLIGPPESKSFVRLGYAVESTTTRVLSHIKHGISYFKAVGKRVIYNARAYIEFPNSTSFMTIDSNGARHEWVITRGVRDYMVGVNNKTGQISPEGYVSDVLLFERVNGKSIFKSVLLESYPEGKFLFEDPRISIVPDGKGGLRIILSGTDYSPHKPPFNSPDVMNRYVELEINAGGEPQPVKVDPVTRLPEFRNLSPAPKFRNGKYFEVDAKNATIAVNELGQIVIRTRLRPNFLDRTVQLMLGKDKWDYAEQVFVFRDWAEFQKYNWNDALVDLVGKADQFPVEGSVRPIFAKEIIRDKDLVEQLSVSEKQSNRARVREEDGKGLGPGTRPLRVRRVGDMLLVSDGPGMAESIHATLTKAEAKVYPLKDGEVTYITFDHEIRKFEQKSDGGKSKRRHYSASVKLFDQTLTQITDYLPDVIQPKVEHELGLRSGILDLQHTYPMGFVIGEPAVFKKLPGYKEVPKELSDRLDRMQKLEYDYRDGIRKREMTQTLMSVNLPRLRSAIDVLEAQIAAHKKAQEPYLVRLNPAKFKELPANLVAQYAAVYKRAEAGDANAVNELRTLKTDIVTFGRSDIRVYAGVSDAHTAIYGFNVKTLIQEAKDHTRVSPRP